MSLSQNQKRDSDYRIDTRKYMLICDRNYARNGRTPPIGPENLGESLERVDSRGITLKVHPGSEMLEKDS